jgi:hypothetical protein
MSVEYHGTILDVVHWNPEIASWLPDTNHTIDCALRDALFERKMTDR